METLPAEDAEISEMIRRRKRHGWRVAIFLLACGSAAIVFSTGERTATSFDTPTAQLATQGGPSDPRWIGVASCGATACHGGNGPAGSKGSEYTTWITRDPHAEAYQVLFNPRSQRIAKNLHVLLKNKPAHESQICLNCHATQPSELGRTGPDFELSFGVGCESCHGPAEKWLGPHTTFVWQSKSWQGTDAEEKTALGMANTKSLTGRAETCVKCHIGAADRDVNHDLIAAGHPRMNFEFGAFHALLPKHWREHRSPSDLQDKDKDVMPDFEARAWAVGQIVSAKAALELLAHRAESPQAPWPEFTEYDCFACHHDLQKTSWRQARGYSGRPGSLPWSNWHFTLLQQALDANASAIGHGLEFDVTKIRSASRAELATAAKSAAADLSRAVPLIEHSFHNPTQLRGWMSRLVKTAESERATTWDNAAQTALALQALHHALSDSDSSVRDPRLNAAIKSLMTGLEFRPRDNVQFDSPHDFTPDDYRAVLKQIAEQLKVQK